MANTGAGKPTTTDAKGCSTRPAFNCKLKVKGCGLTAGTYTNATIIVGEDGCIKEIKSGAPLIYAAANPCCD